MNFSEIKAELSIRMLELEKAIDAGLPYQDIKRIYSKIKELQLQALYAELKTKAADLVIE